MLLTRAQIGYRYRYRINRDLKVYQKVDNFFAHNFQKPQSKPLPVLKLKQT